MHLFSRFDITVNDIPLSSVLEIEQGQLKSMEYRYLYTVEIPVRVEATGSRTCTGLLRVQYLSGHLH